ncbi:jg6976 [Pararge aegeria aegeria]|uniref:Jg6976 protein n=1 Tax=Pararge aegeria aegeria TaxID=348720 RepID=A0A8S4SHH9_9NEOP|nr:jg6976 [Pararge aegeria aegeria]
MGGAHSLENRWTLGVGMATCAGKRSVGDPKLGGQTKSNRGAAGNKWSRILEFGTPYKRPFYSSGRQSVELVMMMK